ncbi:TRAF family member-associated NF-kappa-B activator isoform X2 [Clupea harengus]|uniref:TRAF family member-associated NF-kappa-B activator isoform X2 n=1 Tax=Clupea harengus TaxID=7950 RepID=A0A6P8ETD2_CLUHA|nr:TRAF family member-associated NF-kappa-B activator isoform X2 [Clupea harengus]
MLQGNDIRDCSEVHLHNLAGVSSKAEDILETFQEIQGKFQLIRMLSKRQKDHLKRIHRGKDSANDTQFSMPIQCTDVTAEQAEASFSSSSSSSSSAVARTSLDEPLPASSLATSGLAAGSLAVSSLASRGASPEDGDSVDSLTKLSVKFPPRTDSEYDFLNSAPEKPMQLAATTVHRTGLLVSVLPTIEEPSKELGVPFAYPTSPPPSSSIPSVSSSMSLESVRGPQQPLWSPELSDAGAVASSQACAEPHQQENCAFCHASVPQDRMYSHLNSHFKNSACN